MIISLVMPEAPKRPVYRRDLAGDLRRDSHGQTNPTHRENAAQDEGEEERHIESRVRTLGSGLWWLSPMAQSPKSRVQSLS